MAVGWFWKYMVKKYPDLECGESARETGRTHIPPEILQMFQSNPKHTNINLGR